jgi:hypothetical protein
MIGLGHALSLALAPMGPGGPAWILANGAWNDTGVWDDAADWKDF